MTGPLVGKVTWAGNSALNIYGSLNLSGGAAGITRTYNGAISFLATASGKTIDTNGVTLGGSITISGAGGGWTLSNDLNIGSSNLIYSASGGTLDTNGKTVTCDTVIASSNVKTLTLGSSSINISGSWSLNASDTFNANTSTITNSAAVAFNGAGKTYNVVSLSTNSASTMGGANTFATLSLIGVNNNSSAYALSANQTISGLLTITGNNASSERLFISSDTKGTQRTLSAGSISISNADFQDIIASGASSPWDLSAVAAVGNCGNNTNITATTASTMYWKHGGTASVGMTTTANWYLATNGGGGAGRVPLPQDIAVFDSNSFSASGKTVSQNLPRIGAVDFSLSTNTPTFTTSTAASLYGSLTLNSGVILTASTQAYTTENRSGTLTITSGTKTWAKNWTINSIGGTVILGDDFTTGSTNTFTVTNGTFTDGNFNFTTGRFSSSNSNTRAITQGNVNSTWTLTGNGATIWTTSTSTGLTFTRGTNPIISNYSGSTGTRVIDSGFLSESACPSFDIISGSDALTLSTAVFYNINLSGFTGILGNATKTVYGSITLGTGMTITDGTSATTLAATSGTQVITSNGVTWGGPITQSGVGGTVQFADAFTMPAGRTYTFSAGTIDFNSKTVSMGIFSSSNSTTRVLNNTGGTGTLELTTTSTASAFDMATSTNAIVNLTGLTIKIDGSTANQRTFAGGGKTFGNLWFTNATASGAILISGSNTFSDIKCIDTNTQSLKFTAGTTQHVTTFTTAVAAGQEIRIDSSTTAAHSLIKDGGGTISCDYMLIRHSLASPSGTWYAGVNSIDNQAITTAGSGWVFTAPPAATSIKTLIGLSYASTKTVMGLAIANMKQFTGLT